MSSLKQVVNNSLLLLYEQLYSQTCRLHNQLIPEQFEVCHPRCVSNKSNYKVYVYIVRHNHVLGGMLFTIRKAQLHVSAINVGHLQVVQ